MVWDCWLNQCAVETLGHGGVHSFLQLCAVDVTLMYLSCIWKVTFYFAVVLVRSLGYSFPLLFSYKVPYNVPFDVLFDVPYIKKKIQWCRFYKNVFLFKIHLMAPV